MKLPESLELVKDTLWQIQNGEDFKNVLEDLLTPAEIVDIADRIQILKLLTEGNTQREIAEKLGISITTVSRGSRLLTYERKAIHKYL